MNENYLDVIKNECKARNSKARPKIQCKGKQNTHTTKLCGDTWRENAEEEEKSSNIKKEE